MAAVARTVLRKVELDSFINRDILDKTFNKSGLCAYCQHKLACCLASSCSLIYDCDDYEAGEETNCLLTCSTLDVCKDIEEGYGLCAHCQNSSLCQLKRINGGVWHCEEYL
ncbi:MAG: hypothetical protein PHO32_02125 [Candidatus Cloacimonetes bacterium]|nr:hypothetical protein [Candidatus Cloacimonadota bacterium]